MCDKGDVSTATATDMTVRQYVDDTGSAPMGAENYDQDDYEELTTADEMEAARLADEKWEAMVDADQERRQAEIDAAVMADQAYLDMLERVAAEAEQDAMCEYEHDSAAEEKALDDEQDSAADAMWEAEHLDDTREQLKLISYGSSVRAARKTAREQHDRLVVDALTCASTLMC